MKIADRLTDTHYIAKTKYAEYLETLPIDERAVVLESQQGGQFNGNIYYIAQELVRNPEFTEYAVYICVRSRILEKAKQFYSARGLDGITFVESFSDEYYRLMASAKYLVNDNTFLFFFSKRPEQVYLNTWHGTPLKTLGKRIANDMHNIGNAQRNFIAADLLLYQSEYMAKHMIEDYMLENLSKARYLIDGSPRNIVFNNEGLRSEIRNELGLQGRRVVVYMPTWRGSLGNKRNPITKQNLEYVFEELDARLDSSEYAVFVNLHPIESASIDFSIYNNIKEFPSQYETYEFLTAADILVTDYSSVFFDFAISRRKIILYTFDREHYTSTRGMYLSLEELPFPIVEKMSDLIREIKSPKSYDDSDFLLRFAPNDDPDSCRRLMRRFIFNHATSRVIERSIPDNGKDNVFIYAGKLARNGITSSLRNLINVIDLEKYNIYLLFSSRAVRKSLDVLRDLSTKVNYLTMKGRMNLSLSEKCLLMLWGKGIIDTDYYMSHMHEAYGRELNRIFAGARVDTIIHFTGYGAKQLCLFSEFSGNNVVFVHADVRFEISRKKNLREDAAAYAYRHYKHVAVASEDMIPPVLSVSGGEGNICLCENAIDYKSVLEKSSEEIDLEGVPVLPSVTALWNAFDSGLPLFINVGRYSVEKGQIRLLDAFRDFLARGYDARLIIMGGSGTEYSNVVHHAEEIGLSDKVVFLLNVKNPFPIVKRCDFLALTSFAESFGLVLAEADILGKPVFSTNIPGPRLFLEKYHGTLVEDSVEGIVDGLIQCVSGKIEPMNVDYKQYNDNVVNEFDELLK